MESAAATPHARDRENGHSLKAVTEPIDYGAINAVYGVLFAAVVLATRERAAEGNPIANEEFPILAGATFALAKVVSKEKIGTWVREPFVEEGPDRKPRGARGTRLRRVTGELLTCSRCVGAWSALGIVGLRVAAPGTGRTVANVLAASAANDFLQAGFRWVCNRTD
jgi:hypothetical protein